MANRPVFISDPNNGNYVKTVDVEFDWFPGFSIKQKQRSISSLHNNFQKNYPTLSILEISSKSENELGVALSAFNLTIETKNNKSFSVETAFQSSKVFEHGGPYTDLLGHNSREAKKDQRLKNSGKLIRFQYFNRTWSLEPKTLFYDWLYINALSLNKELSTSILKYDAFSDIEFNPEKSINCQARSAALYISLSRKNLLTYVLESTENYIKCMGVSKEPTKDEKTAPPKQLDLFS
ncbi:DarT1-associated NADAR antitoxin family protein [Paenibacillus rigui]|uniref:Uncharacterized protein n=1 Tax=Paenibacillus rigui TaxID=554312 RepID=A0A229UJV1_9BACL|nr:hypothetical protein [Paenibacillus rigui]OXM83690.1 hypothetical protein CF651_24130 [Paenibacillus rigui]